MAMIVLVRAKLTLEDGTAIEHGGHHDFEEFHPLQRALLPVLGTVPPAGTAPVSSSPLDGRPLYPLGTAVCVGAGWFLTARHLVDPTRLRGTDEEEMFLVLETDSPIGVSETDVFGGLLRIRGYHPHPELDLATLSAELPYGAENEIRKLELSLRMPDVGEPVVALGYPFMEIGGVLLSDGPTTLDWQRSLRASVGVVLEQQPDRTDGWYRPGPAFTADLPAFSGMSGGPVLDESLAVIGFVSQSLPPDEASPMWNSFITLAGPALELSVLDLDIGRNVNAADAAEWRVSQLVAQGAIKLDMFPSCDVNASTGKVTYEKTS